MMYYISLCLSLIFTRLLSYLPPTMEEVYVFALTPAFVCLSVCLSVCKITQKHVHRRGLNVVCRQMLGHGRTD